MVSIIVAYNNQRVIGDNNSIPWDLPEDRRHFRSTTEGGVVIMGRNTWESLGKTPLRNRVNIIVSSSIEPVNFGGDLLWSRLILGSNGEIYAGSIESAVEYAKELAVYEDYKGVYIIGGQKVYEYVLEHDIADAVIATEVNDSSPGDTFFPSLDNRWSIFTQHELSEKALVKVYVRDVKSRMRCSCSIASKRQQVCRVADKQ